MKKDISTMSSKEIFNYIKEEVLNFKYAEEGKEGMKRLSEEFEEYIELIITSLLLDNNSFFGAFIIKLKRNVDFAFEAPAAVSIQRGTPNLYFNPILLFMICKNSDEVKAILIHEVYHLLNFHLLRSTKTSSFMEQRVENEAMDCAINQYIHNLPNGTVTIESICNSYSIKVDDVPPEQEYEYYLDLIKNSSVYKQKSENYEKDREMAKNISKKINDFLNNSQGGSPSDGESNDKNNGNDDGKGNASSNDNTSNQDGEPKDKDNPCGFTEEEKEWIKKHGLIDHSKWKESDNTDVENMKDIVKGIAEEAAKRAGNLPSFIQDMIQKLSEKPKIPWQTEFRRMIGSVKVPYKKVMHRRDRRQLDRYDIKGRISDRRVNLVVAIDTSGSMGERELQYCFNEIFDIIECTNFKLRIIECDMEVQRCYEAKSIKDVDMEVHGRGGTEFTPIFNYVNNDLRKDLDLLIIFTDGYGECQIPESEKPRGYQLMWVLTDKVEHLSVEDPFTNKIRELNCPTRW